MPSIDREPAPYRTCKQWRLRPAVEEPELVAFVRERIVPHYARLSEQVVLRLYRVEGSRSYLAIQEWESEEAWESETTSSEYPAWFEAYRPVLEEWDRLVEFETGRDGEAGHMPYRPGFDLLQG